MAATHRNKIHRDVEWGRNKTDDISELGDIARHELKCWRRLPSRGRRWASDAR